jgi:hypothetical protein
VSNLGFTHTFIIVFSTEVFVIVASVSTIYTAGAIDTVQEQAGLTSFPSLCRLKNQ